MKAIPAKKEITINLFMLIPESHNIPVEMKQRENIEELGSKRTIGQRRPQPTTDLLSDRLLVGLFRQKND